MKFPTLASVAAAACLLVATAPQVQAAEKNLSVIAYNVYFLSEVYSNWGQRSRAKLIADAPFMKNHDIVLLQECFDSDPRAILVDGLKTQYPHFTNVLGQTKSGWDSTTGAYSNTVPENGGVIIMSKWPILEKHQHIFKQGCGPDYWANKGFIYVKLNVSGSTVHVFSTHAQSTDSSCLTITPEKTRSTQFAEMRNYIQNKNIPANELVLMGGDFNVIRASSEYPTMLSALNVNPPDVYKGHSYTWDTKENEIANYNYPGLVPEYLDYIFTEKSHAKTNTTLTALLTESPTPYTIGRDQWHEYSDHYPVVMNIKTDI
ncbi:hypothetical protein DFQ26_000149 [Actinomortierella ambigua]|nr:hypothetical protein DFQ26_000149 [Actinomortierella ambigua]